MSLLPRKLYLLYDLTSWGISSHRHPFPRSLRLETHFQIVNKQVSGLETRRYPPVPPLIDDSTVFWIPPKMDPCLECPLLESRDIKHSTSTSSLQSINGQQIYYTQSPVPIILPTRMFLLLEIELCYKITVFLIHVIGWEERKINYKFNLLTYLLRKLRDY